MKIQAIKTERLSQAQDLCAYIDRFLPQLAENSIVAITSKVVSICEGRMVPKSQIDKSTLIAQEADKILGDIEASPDNIVLTYKDHMLIPSAGIDESNGDDNYILYPQNAFKTAKNLQMYLKEKSNCKRLGVLITDSHTTPFRRGVIGIALAWWGFSPIKSYVGHPDLFGRPLHVTAINVVDALATSAVFNMGEGNEGTPLALLTEVPHVDFDKENTLHSIEEIGIDPRKDLYRPLFSKWIDTL